MSIVTKSQMIDRIRNRESFKYLPITPEDFDVFVDVIAEANLKDLPSYVLECRSDNAYGFFYYENINKILFTGNRTAYDSVPIHEVFLGVDYEVSEPPPLQLELELLNKTYSAEELSDLIRDVEESFWTENTQDCIPIDDDGFCSGSFTVTITWKNY